MTAMRTIIRAATKKEDEPYNIIMMLDDEQSLPYISNLCDTQNKFYFWESINGVDWNDNMCMKPQNCIKLQGQSMREHIDFDIVLCLNRGFFQLCKNIANFWHIPIILFESQIPNEQFKQSNPQDWFTAKNCEGDINVFISDETRDEWEQMGYVIGQNSESFCDSWNNVFQEACSLVYTRI